MKRHLIYISLLISACTVPTENKTANIKQAIDTIPKLTLPIGQRGMKFLDTVTKKIEYGELTLVLKYKKGDTSPFIYSVNQSGQNIDSMAMFEKPLYHGVDSSYDPWVEINTDGTILKSDTSVYCGIIKQTPEQKNKNSITVSCDTVLTVDKFIVDKSGKFTRAKK